MFVLNILNLTGLLLLIFPIFIRKVSSRFEIQFKTQKIDGLEKSRPIGTFDFN